MSKGAIIREIEIAAIEVLNPRERNQRVFQELVESIRLLGLKKPITVAARAGAAGQRYVLVCGQGRMEAFRALGETAIPAQVIEATDEEARAQLELELAAEHDIISGGIARAIDMGVVDEVVSPDRTRTTVARVLLDTPGIRGAHGNIPL